MVGEEIAETSTISEIMEVILGIVVASGGIGEYNLHSRASERVSPHLHPENSTERLEGRVGVEHPEARGYPAGNQKNHSWG
jgi:hypothetical protein